MLCSNSAYIVEVDTGNIIELFPMNTSRKWHSMTWINGFPAVIGGNDGEKSIESVEIYKNDRWEQNSPINIARDTCTSICSQSEVWIIGGINKSTLDSLERYKEGVWKVVDIRLPMPLAYVGLCFLEDYLLLFGGKTRGSKAVDSVYCFDIEQKCMKEVSNLGTPASCSLNTVFIADRIIYALGMYSSLDTTVSMVDIDKIRI